MRDVPELETGRLRVRKFRLEDFEALHRLMDVEIYPPGLEAHQRREWLQWTVLSYGQYAQLQQPPYGERAVVLKDSGELIGAVGYVPCLDAFGQLPGLGGRAGSHHSTEMGLYWAISPGSRRQGFAGEAAAALVGFAFTQMSLVRIVATTEHENLASIGVMRKLGMRIERNPFPQPAWLQVVGILDAGDWKNE